MLQISNIRLPVDGDEAMLRQKAAAALGPGSSLRHGRAARSGRRWQSLFNGEVDTARLIDTDDLHRDLLSHLQML